MLPLSIKNKDEFLGCFYPPEIDGHPLNAKTKMSLFVLRIDGGRFAYEDVKRELGNASTTYVLSRTQSEIKPGREHEVMKKVRDSFRVWEKNDGEGGELFLYCFLETHLGAPKILSKMEMKTAGNDYVKGSDGIHLLDLGDGTFHLIFGESKMLGDSTKKGSSLQKNIAAAIKSVKDVEYNGIQKEISLVDSNLMKETYDDGTLAYLKKIIKPDATNASPVKYNAFGIFIGFEVDIADWNLQEMTNVEFEAKLKSEIKSAVESQYEYIKNKIEEAGLSGYHFYIYAVPFIKNKTHSIDTTRKEIIKHIQ